MWQVDSDCTLGARLFASRRAFRCMLSARIQRRRTHAADGSIIQHNTSRVRFAHAATDSPDTPPCFGMHLAAFVRRGSSARVLDG